MNPGSFASGWSLLYIMLWDAVASVGSRGLARRRLYLQQLLKHKFLLCLEIGDERCWCHIDIPSLRLEA